MVSVLKIHIHCGQSCNGNTNQFYGFQITTAVRSFSGIFLYLCLILFLLILVLSEETGKLRFGMD
jgi:hypothetical protein